MVNQISERIRRLRIEQHQVVDDILADLSERADKEEALEPIAELAITMSLSHKMARLIAVTAELVALIEQIQEQE